MLTAVIHVYYYSRTGRKLKMQSIMQIIFFSVTFLVFCSTLIWHQGRMFSYKEHISSQIVIGTGVSKTKRCE